MKPTEDEVYEFFNTKSRCSTGRLALIKTCQWYHEQCMDTKKGPKVKDAVFYLDTDTIYVITAITMSGNYELSSENYVATPDQIKPATIEQLGKPWDEVPGW